MKIVFAYLLAVLTTAAAVLVNITHADAGTGPRAMAGTVPVVLLLCAVLAHLYRTRSVRLPVLGVAVSSFAVSAVHTYGLAREYHEPIGTAVLYPAVLEFGMTAAIMALTYGRRTAESNGERLTRPARRSGRALGKIALRPFRLFAGTGTGPVLVSGTAVLSARTVLAGVPAVLADPVPVPESVPEDGTDELERYRYDDAAVLADLLEQYRSTGVVLSQGAIMERYRVGKVRAGRIQKEVRKVS